ncbi:uncharacterized protein LOC112893044 isoform X3 [Panicum hallii]|nr:uncharacterized protein LOC112893044 isoform X3 [Panicum hallii]
MSSTVYVGQICLVTAHSRQFPRCLGPICSTSRPNIVPESVSLCFSLRFVSASSSSPAGDGAQCWLLRKENVRPESGCSGQVAEESCWPGARIRMIPGIAPKPAAPPVASVPQPRHMFVFGAGFVGRYVSEHLLAQGWQVSGTCTSPAKKRELEMLGVKASVFDATESNSSLQSIHSLQQATHLLISIPPIPGIGDPLHNLNEDLRRILSHGNLEWLCYLSSTSVYGDCGGALVDEDHMVNPKSESAKLRYEAEKGWLNLVNHLNLSAFIFRLGGIYGPGRSD